MNTEGDKRIVLVSSAMHSNGVWEPNNLQGKTSYGRIRFYSNSKLYNVSSYNDSELVLIVYVCAGNDNVWVTEKT